MKGLWFGSWHDVLHVLMVGTAGYAALVVVLRLSGKRTLAKLNAFDFAVTVALGSTLASTVLTTSVSWGTGVLAFALLAALQFVVAEVSRRLPNGRSLVTARPTLLLRDGQVLQGALRQQRVTVDELRQAVRSTGHGGFTKVAAVVLETDGSLSVIGSDSVDDGKALQGVEGAELRAPA